MTRTAGLRTAALGAAAGLMALPIYWMLATSLRPAGASPAGWLPAALDLGNYRAVLDAIPLGRMYLNTAITSVAAATMQVGLALPMAYAFARIPAPGSRLLFLAVVATMFVPDEMKLIPNFMLVRDLGWSDGYAALVLPVAAHAFPVFVLREHIRRLPRELFEAAMMDGASHLGLIRAAVIPHSAALLLGLWMVALVGRWNDYLWPLVIVERPEMQTLTLGLAALKSAESAGLDWGRLMAGAALTGLPLAVVFALFQGYFAGIGPAAGPQRRG